MKEEKEGQDIRPGYDKKWVKELFNVANEDLECEWCHGVVRNNRELSCCGILACFGCLVKNEKCPKCLETVDPFSLKKNVWANTRIESMAAVCPFAVVNEGETLCSWGKKDQQKLSETDSHVNECPAVEVTCEICAVKVQRCNMTQHLEDSVPDHLLKLREQICKLRAEAVEGKGQKEAMENKINVLEEGVLEGKEELKIISSKLEESRNYAFCLFFKVGIIFLCSFIVANAYTHQATKIQSNMFSEQIEIMESNQIHRLDDASEYLTSKLANALEQLVTYDQFKILSEQTKEIEILESEQSHLLDYALKQFNAYDNAFKNMDKRLQLVYNILNSTSNQEYNSDETVNSKLAGALEQLNFYDQQLLNMDERLRLVSEQVNSRSNQEYNLENLVKTVNSRFSEVIQRLITYDQEIMNMDKRLQLVSKQLNRTNGSVSEQLATFFKQKHAKLEQMESKEVEHKTKLLELDSLMINENFVAEHLFSHWKLYSVMCFLLFYLRRITVQTLIPKFFPWVYCSRSYLAWFLNLLLDSKSSSLYWLWYWHTYSELKNLLDAKKISKEDYLKSRTDNGDFPLNQLCNKSKYPELKPLLDEMKFLKEHYLKSRTDNGDFPLYQLCNKNKYPELKPLLDKMKFSKEDYLKSRTDNGDFPLNQLCEWNYTFSEIKPFLNEMKFSKEDYLQSRTDNGDFPLFRLCEWNYTFSEIKPLLDEMKFSKEDYLKSRTDNGDFPLYPLCSRYNISTLKPFLDEMKFSKEDYLKSRTDNGDFPLFRLCSKNDYSELKPFLDEMNLSKANYLEIKNSKKKP